MRQHDEEGFSVSGPVDDDRDWENHWEAVEERRALHRATRCQCGTDLPGRCPGPMSCPYSDFNGGDEAEQAAHAEQELRDAVGAALADNRGDLSLADVRRIVGEELEKLAPRAGEPRVAPTA